MNITLRKPHTNGFVKKINFSFTAKTTIAIDKIDIWKNIKEELRLFSSDNSR